jgi:hypothetical protein
MTPGFGERIGLPLNVNVEVIAHGHQGKRVKEAKFRMEPLPVVHGRFFRLGRRQAVAEAAARPKGPQHFINVGVTGAEVGICWYPGEETVAILAGNVHVGDGDFSLEIKGVFELLLR